VPDVTVQDVEHHLEVDVDVRRGHAAWRNRRHVHRQLPRPGILRRQPRLVLNAIPAANVAAAADDENPVRAFDDADHCTV
jgi:hypothetical protein